MSSVKVAVRVRPFNQREKDSGSKRVIEMEGNSTKITDPVTKIIIINRNQEKTGNLPLIIHIGLIPGKSKHKYKHARFTDDANGEKVKDSPNSKYADQKLVFKDMVLSVTLINL
jgi:hypothetical protein